MRSFTVESALTNRKLTARAWTTKKTNAAATPSCMTLTWLLSCTKPRAVSSVHSAMIFEEIESHGGEIISISENIDNSLNGKLIRSIMAWSAQSERHKIVEYANRRWQTRVEVGLPVG